MSPFEICVTAILFLILVVGWLHSVLVDLKYYKKRSEQYEQHYHNLLLGKKEDK